jgi:hypothetical protein
MVFPVKCLAHQSQGLLNVICNEKQVGSGRWHMIAIFISDRGDRCLFVVLFSCGLHFNVFPFPPSKSK